MAMVEAAMTIKRALAPVDLGDAPTDSRIMQVWEALYQDFRVEGLSSVLFESETSARAFAGRHGNAKVSPRWVTMLEYSNLRKQRRL